MQKIQNKHSETQKHIKKYQQIVQPFFVLFFFACRVPAIIWRRRLGAEMNSGNADKFQIGEQIQIPPV